MSSPYSSLIDLGVLLEGNNGLSGSGALAMNDAGQVVGWSHALSNTALHAFIDSPPYTAMTDLGALGRDSEAWAINNSGQVVGSTDNGANYASHAFLYTPGTGMVDLNTVLPNGSGWTLNIATGINDNGQITGWATNANGVQHAFLLSPLNPLQVLVNALTAAINQLSLNSQAKALLLQYVNQLPTAIAQLTSAQKTHLIRQLTALESIVHGMVTGKRITAAQRTQLITLINDFIAALRA